jgi:hypothetical protein
LANIRQHSPTFSNIRQHSPTFAWTYFAHTVVFSHAQPDKTETDFRLYGKSGLTQ